MTGDLEAAERALVDAIKALEPDEPPRSHELRTAWRDLGPSWIVNWAVSLGRDVRNAASALDRASELGATDEGAAEVENALWRVDSAYEKLHDVLSSSLGVPALKLNANRKGVKRFESDRKAIRKRLREVAEGHPAAGELLKLDESIANHRFLELRHQLTHSLAPILAWQSMTFFEVGVLDDSGGVVGFSSHHLTPADNLQVSIPPDQLYARTLTDGREIVELLIQAMAVTAELLTSTGELPPPPVLWQVRSTGLVYLDQAEAAQAAREASS